MGIRETLGVGRTTKIKLVDRQRNRLDEEVEIITRNANNSNDLEMQSDYRTRHQIKIPNPFSQLFTIGALQVPYIYVR